MANLNFLVCSVDLGRQSRAWAVCFFSPAAFSSRVTAEPRDVSVSTASDAAEDNEEDEALRVAADPAKRVCVSIKGVEKAMKRKRETTHRAASDREIAVANLVEQKAGSRDHKSKTARSRPPRTLHRKNFLNGLTSKLQAVYCSTICTLYDTWLPRSILGQKSVD